MKSGSQSFKSFVNEIRYEFSQDCKIDSWWYSLTPARRVSIENLLIAYDQMADKIDESLTSPVWPGGEEIEDVWASRAHSFGSFQSWKAAIQWLKERAGGGEDDENAFTHEWLLIHNAHYRQGWNAHIQQSPSTAGGEKAVDIDSYCKGLSTGYDAAVENLGEKEEVIWEDMETGERIYPQNNNPQPLTSGKGEEEIIPILATGETRSQTIRRLQAEIAKLKSGEQLACKFAEWTNETDWVFKGDHWRKLLSRDTITTDQLLTNYLTEVKQKK